jgi:ElaB/YqjD/DUF883 family membrane-anchored ribosome-binding protein
MLATEALISEFQEDNKPDLPSGRHAHVNDLHGVENRKQARVRLACEIVRFYLGMKRKNGRRAGGSLKFALGRAAANMGFVLSTSALKLSEQRLRSIRSRATGSLMTVRQAGQYKDAVIEGTVSGVDPSGRLSGRSEMSLTFDTIRLRNRQTYRFAGILESVQALNGDAIKVDNEGSAQRANQTTRTIQRAGVATAVGAIIGTLASGGKGAAIGGIIDAAGGAGSVFIQGKENLELLTGTELTIRSSGPR